MMSVISLYYTTGIYDLFILSWVFIVVFSGLWLCLWIAPDHFINTHHSAALANKDILRMWVA